MTENQRRSFTFIPHYKTLTRGGSSHFSRVSDALAEFIDNSIQASQFVKLQRDIHITFDLNFYSGESYVLISDNGKGMNESELCRFARYCDALSYTNSETNPSLISLYGVGAKQAGFYLGDRLHIITKSVDLNGKILELTLDEQMMEQRHKADQNVYESQYYIQSTGIWSDMWHTFNYPQEFQEVRRQYESNNQQDTTFTIMIIRLRDVIVRNLQMDDQYQKLPSLISDIYHFHLHPENLPNTTMRRMTEQTDGEETSLHTFPPPGWRDPFREATISSISKSSIYQTPPTPLAIHIRAKTNGASQYNFNLKEIRTDLNSCLFEKASYCFRFSFQIPDPNFEERSTASQGPSNIVARNPQKIWTQEHTGGNHREVTVHGLILYFPFHNGISTLPTHSLIPLSDMNGQTVDCCDLTEDDSSINSKVFRVYWQNRLVPETQLGHIPFFPLTNTQLQCDKLKIPINWKQNRIKGFLFFDSNFRNISNNKLKLKFDPDFDTWLNDTQIKKKVTYNPKNIEKDFTSWLQICHRVYDDELKFENRVTDNEQLARAKELNKKEKFTALYSKLIHTVGSQVDEIQIDDFIKLFPTKRGRKVKDNEVIFVKVLGFLPSTSQSLTDQDICYGTGHIWYTQVPNEIYGTSEHLESVSAIDFNNYLVSDEEINDIKNKAACDIKAVVHRTDYLPEHRAGESIKKGLVVDVGENIQYLAIRVLNKKREVLTSPPGTNRKYRVKLSIPTMGKDFGTTLITYSRSITEEGRVEFQSSDKVKDAHQGFHLFQDLRFRESGKHIMKIEVFDGDQLVLNPFEYPLIIKSGPVAAFSILGDFSSPIPLGGYLPPFALEFKDEYGQNTVSSNLIQVSLSANGLKFSYHGNGNSNSNGNSNENENENPEFQVDSSGRITFDTNQWISLPLNEFTSEIISQNEPFISNTKVGSKKVKIQVKASICAQVAPFTITYIPGYPNRILFLHPPDGHLSIPNCEELDPVILVCFDEYGNRCAPCPQFGSKWDIVLDKKGPFAGSNNRFPVQADGIAKLTGLRIELEDVPYPGVREVQSLFLDWPSHLGNNKDFKISEELVITITPGTKPHSMEIICGDDILTECNHSVGDTITGLRLQIMTESGSIWEPTPSTSLIVKPDWNKNNTQNKKKTKGKNKSQENQLMSLDLPDIKLPINCDEKRITYEVECIIDSKYSFMSEFYVNLEPSKPCKWKLFTSPDVKNGICCNARDFSEKIQSVWLVDEYENDIPNEYNPTSIPYIGISWINGDETECDQKIRLILVDSEMKILSQTTSFSQSKKIKKYILPSDINLHCEKSLPSPFWLRVFDQDNTYQSIVESFTAIASYPSKILLRCSSVFGEDSLPLQTLEPFPFTLSSKITDLEISLVDENNHNASMSKLVDILIKVSVILNSDVLKNDEVEESEIILYSYTKKNPKNKLSNISIDFSTITEKIKPYRQLENDDIINLEVTCSYSLNGTRHHSTSATIVGKFLWLNTIDKINPSFRILSSDPRNKPLDEELDSYSNSIYDSLPRLNENTCQCGYYSEINLLIQTNDSKVAEISEKDIDIQLSYENSKRKVIDSEHINSVLNLQEIKSSGRVNSTPLQTIITYWIPIMTQPGKYHFKFIYTESRPKIINKKNLAKSSLQCESSITITCIPGEGRKLELAKNSKQLLHNICATNSEQSSEADRTIAKSLEFTLKDSFGNDTTFPDDCHIIAYLNRLNDDRSDSSGSNTVSNIVINKNVPLFVDPSVKNGTKVLASLPSTQYSHSFPLIQLIPSHEAVGGDGIIQLIFELKSRNNQYNTSIVDKFTFDFNFTTDEGRAEIERQCRDEITPYSTQLHELEEHCHIFSQEYDQLKQYFNSLIQKAQELGLGGYLTSSSQLTQTEIMRYQNEKIDERDQMIKVNQHVRKVKKLHSIKIPDTLIENQIVIGQVIDLGFVESERNLPEIISWAAMDYMEALVVKGNNFNLKDSFSNDNIFYFDLNRIVPFQNSSGGFRTEKQKKEHKLPIEIPFRKEKVPGNPRFMINLLQLDPNYEYLRDTIFYQIFQNNIVIDTERNGLTYRNLLVRENYNPMPTIYTLDGYCIRGNGLIYPLRDVLPESLSYVFGEISPTSLIEFKNIERELKLIDEMLIYFKKEKELKSKITTIHEDIDQIKNQIEEIEKKYGVAKNSTYKERSMFKASELLDHNGGDNDNDNDNDDIPHNNNSNSKKKLRQSIEQDDNNSYNNNNNTVESSNPKKKSRKT